MSNHHEQLRERIREVQARLEYWERLFNRGRHEAEREAEREWIESSEKRFLDKHIIQAVRDIQELHRSGEPWPTNE